MMQPLARPLGGGGGLDADLRPSLLRVQLTEIQDGVIERAHCEGRVNPAAFASGMLHDLDDVHAAIDDLVNRGLVTADEGNTFRLTDQGEAHHRRQEEANRAAVVARTGTWPSR